MIDITKTYITLSGKTLYPYWTDGVTIHAGISIDESEGRMMLEFDADDMDWLTEISNDIC